MLSLPLMVCLTSHLQPKLSAFSVQPDLPPSGESGDVQGELRVHKASWAFSQQAP